MSSWNEVAAMAVAATAVAVAASGDAAACCSCSFFNLMEQLACVECPETKFLCRVFKSNFGEELSIVVCAHQGAHTNKVVAVLCEVVVTEKTLDFVVGDFFFFRIPGSFHLLHFHLRGGL